MTDPLAPIVEDLAALQWKRMSRTHTTYAELTPSDQAACRAIVAPVLADLQRLGLVITNADSSSGTVVTTITIDTSGRHRGDSYYEVQSVPCPGCSSKDKR